MSLEGANSLEGKKDEDKRNYGKMDPKANFRDVLRAQGESTKTWSKTCEHLVRSSNPQYTHVLSVLL